MSTKTTFKRIALVVVAALTLGGFTAVSASAADGDITQATGFTITGSGSATATVSTTAGTNNFIGFSIATATTNYAVLVTGGTASSAATTVSGSGTAALVATANGSSTAFTVPTPTVGTIVVKSYAFTNGVQAATATSSLTITVAAAATGVGVLSVGNSTSYITESATVGGITSFATTPALTKADAATALAALSIDDATAVTKGTAGSPAIAAVIVGVLKDSQVPTAAAMAGKTLTATITGSGLLTGSATTDAALGTTPARVATAVTGTTAAGAWAFGVYSDGSAGVGTITVSYTDALNVTTVIATKTITFYGSAASFTATTKTKYIANTGSAWPLNAYDPAASLGSTRYAVKIVVKDSAGNPVGGVTPTAKIAAADQISISSGTCTASTYTSGSSYCSLTGVAGAADANVTVTFYTGSTTTFNYVSADVPVMVVSQKAATFTVTAEAEASAGGLIKYTITAKDAAGNPVADGTLVSNYLYGSPTIAGGALTDYASVNANAVSALFTGVRFYNGVATETVQAPFGKTTVSADFYGNGALAATTGGTYFTTAALRNFNTVVDTKVVLDETTAQAAADAAAEATDAANAATDAANAAAEAADAATAAAQDAADAVAALSTQVSEMVDALKKQITALTNLVIKIQKKVKA